MTVKEYLLSKNKCGEMNQESLQNLINELKESNPTKEEVVEGMTLFLKELGKTYTNGFEACISELDKVDANFLSRKKPPHLK